MALFILGAGATRGASFVKPNVNPCLPPLDADFYAQLQRIGHPKHQDIVAAVIRDTVELFGVNFIDRNLSKDFREGDPVFECPKCRYSTAGPYNFTRLRP
jgi:hypothetical protein